MMNSTSMEACRQLIKITGRSYCTKVYLLYKDVLQTTTEEESKKAVKNVFVRWGCQLVMKRYYKCGPNIIYSIYLIQKVIIKTV